MRSRCTCLGAFAKLSSSYGVSGDVPGTSVSSAIFSVRAIALEGTFRPPGPFYGIFGESFQVAILPSFRVPVFQFAAF